MLSFSVCFFRVLLARELSFKDLFKFFLIQMIATKPTPLKKNIRTLRLAKAFQALS